MEPLSIGDWLGAASTFTAPVNVMLQWIKQSPKWKNSWSLWFAPAIGVIIAVSWLIVGDKLQLVDGQLMADKVTLYKAVLEGFFGGAVAPVAYKIQKQLPFQLLAPAPDNHPADANVAAVRQSNQGEANAGTSNPARMV